MLGEKIGEEHGRVITRRILPGDDYRYVKMEITIETQITIYGVEGMNIGTYTVFERVPGQLYGEGQGVVQTMDGQGAIWNGHGVGHMEGDKVAIAAAVAFQAPAEGPLSRLNGVMCLAEHYAALDGSTADSNLFEWKA
jgi:hypothetical protein